MTDVTNKKKLLFIVNDASYFISHRLPIALKAQNFGYEIHIASPSGSDKELEESNFYLHYIKIIRGGTNPFYELLSIYQSYKLITRIRPDLIHLVTVKPVIYGGIAARLAKAPAVVAAIAGLGSMSISQKRKWKLLKLMTDKLYSMALNHNNLAVIFQNPSDKQSLLKARAIQEKQSRIIRGSGVAIADYPFVPEKDGTPVVTMAARLLHDKGVIEFIQAARLLDQREITVEFRLIGNPDPANPSSIPHDKIKSWQSEKNIEILGYQENISRQYAESHIVCLPSYREGLPKSLVEAAACGRAVVTTDVPGCRDAIEPGVSGTLVPKNNVTALADAIQELIESPQRRQSMGRAGRSLAEREFSIEKIVDQHIAIYQELDPVNFRA